MSKNTLVFALIVFFFLSAASVAVAIDNVRAGSLPDNQSYKCFPSNTRLIEVKTNGDVYQNGGVSQANENGVTVWHLVSIKGEIEHPSEFFDNGNDKSSSISNPSISMKNPQENTLPYTLVSKVSEREQLPVVNLRTQEDEGSLWVKELIDGRLGFTVEFDMKTADYQCAKSTEIDIPIAYSEQQTSYMLSKDAEQVLEEKYCGYSNKCRVFSLIACGQYKIQNGVMHCTIEYQETFTSIDETNGAATCGPEGMALVVKPDGKDAIGLGGSGLGYANAISKALVVEWDNKVDAGSEFNSRHISVSIHRKSSTQIETDKTLFAWSAIPPSWNPYDFNVDNKNSINPGKWTATFYDGLFELKVSGATGATPILWIPPRASANEEKTIKNKYNECNDMPKNSASQSQARNDCFDDWSKLKLSYRFSLPSAALADSPEFQVGFTASKGPSGSGDIAVSNIKVTEFQPVCSYDSNHPTITVVDASGEETDAVINEKFYAVISIRDSCGNLVWTDDIGKFTKEDTKRLSFDLTYRSTGSQQVCNIGAIVKNNFANVEGQFQAEVVCKTIAAVSFSIKWYQCSSPHTQIIKVYSCDTEQCKSNFSGATARRLSKTPLEEKVDYLSTVVDQAKSTAEATLAHASKITEEASAEEAAESAHNAAQAAFQVVSHGLQLADQVSELINTDSQKVMSVALKSAIKYATESADRADKAAQNAIEAANASNQAILKAAQISADAVSSSALSVSAKVDTASESLQNALKSLQGQNDIATRVSADASLVGAHLAGVASLVATKASGEALKQTGLSAANAVRAVAIATKSTEAAEAAEAVSSVSLQANDQASSTENREIRITIDFAVQVASKAAFISSGNRDISSVADDLEEALRDVVADNQASETATNALSAAINSVKEANDSSREIATLVQDSLASASAASQDTLREATEHAHNAAIAAKEASEHAADAFKWLNDFVHTTLKEKASSSIKSASEATVSAAQATSNVARASKLNGESNAKLNKAASTAAKAASNVADVALQGAHRSLQEASVGANTANQVTDIKAKVEWIKTNPSDKTQGYGDIDNNVEFLIVGDPSLGALTPPAIQITWPNDNYNQKNIQIKKSTRNGLNVYNYRITSTDVGTYKIESSILDKTYSFYMDSGMPSFKYSKITPVAKGAGFASGWTRPTDGIYAGTDIDLLLLLADSAGNSINPKTKSIDYSKISLLYKVVNSQAAQSNGVVVAMKQANVRDDGYVGFPIKLTTAGLQTFTILIDKMPVSCTYCTLLNVIPTDVDYSNSVIWLANPYGVFYNTDLTEFQSLPQDRQDYPRFWLRLKDKYGNYLDSAQDDYKLHLSGYGLEYDGKKEFCGYTQTSNRAGYVFTYCNGCTSSTRSTYMNDWIFHRLVFRPQYTAELTVYKKGTSTVIGTKKFTVSINRKWNEYEIDQDADNAPLSLEKSTFTSNGTMVAGIWNNNYFIFRTATGARYNMPLNSWYGTPGVRSSIGDGSFGYEVHNYGYNWWWFSLYTHYSKDHIRGEEERQYYVPIDMNWHYTHNCYIRIDGSTKANVELTKRVVPNRLFFVDIDIKNIEPAFWGDQYCQTWVGWWWAIVPCLNDKSVDDLTDITVYFKDYFRNPTKYTQSGRDLEQYPTQFESFDGRVWRPEMPRPNHYLAQHCSQSTCDAGTYSKTYNQFKISYPLRNAYINLFSGYAIMNCYYYAGCQSYWGRRNVYFYIYNHPGRPNAGTSFTALVNDDRSWMVAGGVVGFNVVFRDAYWNLIPPSYYYRTSVYPEMYKDIKISAYVEQPIGSSPTAKAVHSARQDVNVANSWGIWGWWLYVRNIRLTQAGLNIFYVVINDQKVGGANWVWVIPNWSVWENSDIWSLEDGKWKYMDPGTSPVIKNYNSYPSFYLRVKDTYHNYRNELEGDHYRLNAYLYDMQKRRELQYYPSQAQGVSGSLVMQFISRIYAHGQQYYLDDSYYWDGSQNQTNLFTYPYGQYQIVFSTTRGSAYHQILRNIILYGEGAEDAQYDTNVDAPLQLAYTAFSNNNFNVTAGQWGQVEVTFKTNNNKPAKFKYVDIYRTGLSIVQTAKTNPSDSDKKEDTVVWRNFMFKNHPTKEGTMIVYIRQMRKGDYYYTLKANVNYRNQGSVSLGTVATQIHVRFNHDTPKYIVWNEESLIKKDDVQLSHQRVDDANVFKFMAFDQFHNKVEELKDEQASLNIQIARMESLSDPAPTWSIARTGFEQRTLTIKLQQSGVYEINAIGFKRNFTNIDMTQVGIEKSSYVREWATYVDATKSIARINVTELNAGENLGYTVKLFDKFGNKFDLVSRPFAGEGNPITLYTNSMLCFKYSLARHENTTVGDWFCMDKSDKYRYNSVHEIGRNEVGFTASMYWAGKTEVAVYFNSSEMIPATLGTGNAKVSINPLSPDFETTNLVIRDTFYQVENLKNNPKLKVDDRFVSYKKPNPFTYHIEFNPLLRLSIQDKYGNDVGNLPDEFFKYEYTVVMDNSRESGNEIVNNLLRLDLCKTVLESMGSTDRIIEFSLCPAPEEADEDEELDPAWQYGNFFPGDYYTVNLKMTLKETGMIYLQKIYNLKLTGVIDESGIITGLPENLAMTSIKETKIITKAGKQAQINFDLIASNGKRRYYWYPRKNDYNKLYSWSFMDVSPSEFPGQVFNTSRGLRRGMHVTTANTTKAFGVTTDPIKVRLTAFSYEVMGKDVTWVNEPVCKNDDGEYDVSRLKNVQFRDSKYPDTEIFNKENYYTRNTNGLSQEVPVLPQGKVGSGYKVMFSVHDIYNNACPLLISDQKLMDMVIARVSYPEEVTTVDQDGVAITEVVTQDADFTLDLVAGTNYFVISFSPVYSANHTIVVNGRSSVTWVQPGDADPKKSTARVIYSAEDGAGFKAGSSITVSVSLKDMNGNSIKYVDRDLTRIKAYYKKTGDKFWTLFKSTTPKVANNGYELTLSESITLATEYSLQVTMSDVQLSCPTCKIEVIPSGLLDFQKTKLLFLSPMSAQWISFTAESNLTINTVKETPSFSLQLTDQYGNIYTSPNDTLKNYESLEYTCKFVNDPNEKIQTISSQIEGEIAFEIGYSSSGPIFDLGASIENWEKTTMISTGMALLEFGYTVDGTTSTRKISVKLFNQANTGTDTAALDLSKTVIFNEGKYSTMIELEGDAGDQLNFMVEFKTINNLRKGDLVPNITASFENTPMESDRQPAFTGCSFADVGGRVICQFYSNVSYTDTLLSVVLSQNGQAIPVKIDARINPGPVSNATVFDDYVSNTVVGTEAYFTIGGYDDFGNPAAFETGNPGAVVEPLVKEDETENTKIPTPDEQFETDEETEETEETEEEEEEPEGKDETGYQDDFSDCDRGAILEMSKEPGLKYSVNDNGEFSYTFVTQKAGIHVIKGRDFVFKYIAVQEGLPDPAQSTLVVRKTAYDAGQFVEFVVIGKDKYGNVIGRDYMVGNSTLFDIRVVLEDKSELKFAGKDLVAAPVTTGYTDALYGKIQITKAGTHKFVGTAKSSSSEPGFSMKCENCQVIISPNDLEITKTFARLPDVAGEGAESTDSTSGRRLQVENDQVLKINDDESLNILVNLLDIYGNKLEAIPDNAFFSAVVFGNGILEVEPITLEVNSTETSGNTINILSGENEDAFIALVPLEGYTVRLTYYLDEINPNRIQGVVDISLTIEGENIGYSNGPLSIPSTYIEPQYLSFTAYEGTAADAGLDETFLVQLKTTEQGSPLYHGDFDSSRLTVKAPEGVSCIIDPQEGTPGIFRVTVQSSKANYDQDTYPVDVLIDGTKVGKTVSVRVNPATPDISKTLIEKKWAEDYVMINQQNTIHISMYDSFGNVIKPNPEYISYLSATFYGGNGDVADIGEGPNDVFVMNFKANFPVPNTLTMQITWSIDPIVAIGISDPLVYPIYTRLDSSRTDIYGEYFYGTSVDNVFTHYVLPKDDSGLCYTRQVKINAKITGPYKTNNPTDTKPFTSADTITEYKGIVIPVDYSDSDTEEISNLNSISECKYIYLVNYGVYDDFRPVKAGWWEVSVQVIGEEVDRDVSNGAWVTERVTYLTFGELDVNNSVIEMLGAPKGRGRESLYLKASQTYNWMFIGYDRFGNRYSPQSPDYVLTLDEIEGVTQKVSKLSYGVYTVQTTFELVGEYNSFPLTFSARGINQASDYKSIKKNDAPDSIIVSPGDCSNVYPSIDLTDLGDLRDADGIPIIKIGEQLVFTIDCMDEFSNDVLVGGEDEEFIIYIKGFELMNVGKDQVHTQIIDNDDGSYDITFIPAWAGQYSIIILLNGIQYSETIDFIGVDSICQDSANPILCPDEVTCASTYNECGIEELADDCPVETPIRCPINGVDTCVAAGIKCDCPTGFSKCADFKCIPQALAEDLCPYYTVHVEAVQCPTEYPVYCPTTGGCRQTTDDCPSQPVCPPGYDLCPDLSCASQVAGGCVYENHSACPALKYKCPDGSCESRPENCATQITCLNPDDYLCATNNQCVSSPLECAQPNTCAVEGQVQCPRDNSCVNDISSCPSGVVCSQTGYSLCENEECKPDCRAIEDTNADMMIDVFFRRRALSHRRALVDEEEFLQPITQVICPSGTIANTLYNCPALPSCGTDAIRCPDGSCSSSLSQCVEPTCETGFKCWDGRCVTEYAECSTRPVCPESLPVKCADGTCALDQTSCGVIECPPNQPYRCGSGECATTNEQCPTQSNCPISSPIKCADNSCVKAPYHCNAVVSGFVCNDGYIMCPDGSCSMSQSLCPTFKTCQTDMYMCVDGSCVDSVELCNDISSFSNFQAISQLPIRCPSGEFRAKLVDCPTEIICPEGKVKCTDGNCRDNKDFCYAKDQCEFELRLCPDGSCASGLCSTSVTCTLDAPFKCQDQTCRKDPRDCPVIAECPRESPILCGNGECVSHRYKCAPELPTCPASSPVLCPSLTCARSVDDCSPITTCPTGTIRCATGECRSNMGLCREETCPSNLPTKCPNGLCVEDAGTCDDQTTGCPFDQPIRCGNGQCVEDEDRCESLQSVCGADTGKQPCPDGSCYPADLECPNQQGCLKDEIMCASGTCGETCSISTCPEGTVKCLSGLCVDSFSSCPDIFTTDDYTRCSENLDGRMVPCADGRCVSSAEECKALAQCRKGYVRCSNGQCRRFEELCPRLPSSVVCPANRSIMCDNGMCSTTAEECILLNGCPVAKSYKCKQTGLCVEDSTMCDEDTSLSNCPAGTPYICADGTCVDRLDKCPSAACPGATPYKCLDGSCSESFAECLSKGPSCSEDKVLCPDQLTCKDSFDQCLATNGCPVNKPFKCGSNAGCVSDPYECDAAVICPSYEPFLCLSGECAGSSALCASTTNKTETNADICPPTTPVLCQDGKCVNSLISCGEVAKTCPEAQSYQCATGNCVEYPFMCTVDSLPEDEIVERVLQESETNEEEILIDQGCSKTYPTRCFDGSCRISADSCPIFPGCTSPEKPFLCKSGACAVTMADCLLQPEVQCKEGQTACIDGMCRADCSTLRYNGCGHDELICSNGRCVKSLAECAGTSACNNIETPFRCVQGNCVKSLTECDKSFRYFISEEFQLTMTPTSSKKLNFMVDKKMPQANILIPSGALLTPTTALLPPVQTPSKLTFSIRPVAWSELDELANPIDSSNALITGQLFPLTDGKLDKKNYNFIRSPIVEFSTAHRSYPETDYRYPIKYTVKADNIEDPLFDPYNMMCLGRQDISKKSWFCVSRKVIYDETNSKYTFEVPRDGVYAVIFNPRPPPEADEIPTCQGYICQYIAALGVVGITTLIIIACLGYIFSRLYRYMMKYRSTKKTMSNYDEVINEMMSMTTENVAMSLRDKIEGITFTKNAMYRNRPDEEVEINKLREILNRVEAERANLDAERNDIVAKNKFFAKEIEILRNELDRRRAEGSVDATVEIEAVQHEFGADSSL